MSNVISFRNFIPLCVYPNVMFSTSMDSWRKI